VRSKGPSGFGEWIDCIRYRPSWYCTYLLNHFIFAAPLRAFSIAASFYSGGLKWNQTRCSSGRCSMQKVKELSERFHTESSPLLLSGRIGP